MLTETDSERHDLPEVPAMWMAAIFRLLGDAAENIRATAGFTYDEVQVKTRSLN